MGTLETPLRLANVLTEPSQKSSRDGVFVARTLVRARPRVRVRILDVTNRDQDLGESSIIGQGETEEQATVIDDYKHQPRRKQGVCKRLKVVIADATTNVSLGDTQTLEDIIAEYQDILETKSGA
jgi:hypothetical protein